MSTGDIKNNIRMLQTELRLMKYPESLDIPGLTQGNAKAFMPLYHYAFTSYNAEFAQDISAKDIVLFAKSDTAFMDAIYKILRDMFTYKPMVTKSQFFSSQFAERKVIMCTEVLQQVQKRCRTRVIARPLSAFRLSKSLDKISKPPSGQNRSRTKKDFTNTDMPPPFFAPTAKSDTKRYKSRASLPGNTRPRVVKEVVDPNITCDYMSTPSIPRVQPRSVEVVYMPRSHASGDNDSVINVAATTRDDSMLGMLQASQAGGDNLVTSEPLHILSSTVNRLMERVEDIDGRLELMEMRFSQMEKSQSSQAAIAPTVAASRENWTNQSARLQLLENRMVILEAKNQDANTSNMPGTPSSESRNGRFVTVESFINGESKVRKMAREAEAKIRSHSAEDLEIVSPIRKPQPMDALVNSNHDEIFTIISEHDPELQRSSTPTKHDTVDLKLLDTPIQNQAERIKNLMISTESMLAPVQAAQSPTIPADEANRQHVD